MFLGSNEDFKLIAECSKYASIAHGNQFRADGVTPYIVHPARVYALVANTRYASPELCSAAWLHDVLENCVKNSGSILNTNGETKEKHYMINVNKVFPDFTTFEDFLLGNKSIKSIVGNEILSYVKMVSNSNTTKDKKLDTYKRLYSSAHNSCIVLKACDRIDNLSNMYDSFSVEKQISYIEDTHVLLGYISKKLLEADENLFCLLNSILEEAERKINNDTKRI